MASEEVTGSAACEDAAALLPDAWAGTLDGDSRRRLDAHLATCDACRREAAALADLWTRIDTPIEAPPSDTMRERFAVTLAAYTAGQRDARGPRTVRWQPWMGALAAAAVIVVIAGLAFFGGMVVTRRQTVPDVVALHREVQTMRQMLALSLLQQQSASERLRGLSVSTQLDRPDEAVLAALVTTLATDPNVNVRLSAIDALKSFSAEPRVRDGLIDALPRQPSPLVQIALIDSLVELGERRAVGAFRALAADERANQTVRARAAEAVQQLS